jgi:hypothetical protein
MDNVHKFNICKNIYCCLNHRLTKSRYKFWKVNNFFVLGAGYLLNWNSGNIGKWHFVHVRLHLEP